MLNNVHGILPTVPEDNSNSDNGETTMYNNYDRLAIYKSRDYSVIDLASSQFLFFKKTGNGKGLGSEQLQC